MATTLTYGLVRPATGDRGSVFFPALEDNITQLDAHDHDGTDSAKLTTASSNTVTASVSSGSWSSTGSIGLYRQLITLPASLSYDTIQIFFRDPTSGETYWLRHEKVSASTFYVYINDNSLSLTAVYVS